MDINELLTQATPFIEWTYDKRMDIYGEVETTKPNGATDFVFDVMVPNVSCRVSVVKLANTDQDQANRLTETLKLFCSADVNLPAGSLITVDGVKYESTDEPMKYATHQEVLIYRKAWI